MKKILILVMLLTTVMSCELFDAAKWEEHNESRKRRGRVCEEDEKGYYHCYDRY